MIPAFETPLYKGTSLIKAKPSGPFRALVMLNYLPYKGTLIMKVKSSGPFPFGNVKLPSYKGTPL